MHARTTSSKAGTTGKKTSDAAVASGSSEQVASNPPDLASQYSEAYLDLARGLQEGMTAVQTQQNEVYAAFEAAREEMQREALKRATEAYQDYVKAGQCAPATEQGQKQLEEAYHNYVATLTGLHEEATPKVQQASEEMVSAASRIATDAQKQARQQYVDYLSRLQRAWAGVDVKTLV